MTFRKTETRSMEDFASQTRIPPTSQTRITPTSLEHLPKWESLYKDLQKLHPRKSRFVVTCWFIEFDIQVGKGRRARRKALLWRFRECKQHQRRKCKSAGRPGSNFVSETFSEIRGPGLAGSIASNISPENSRPHHHAKKNPQSLQRT